MNKMIRLTAMIGWVLALMGVLVFIAVAKSSVAEAQSVPATVAQYCPTSTSIATAKAQVTIDCSNATASPEALTGPEDPKGDRGHRGSAGNAGGGKGGNGGGGDRADAATLRRSNEQNTVVQDSICTNVNQAASNQYSGGDQAGGAGADDIIGDENSAAEAANIANALGISQVQVNACLNQVNATASASVASVSVASASVASAFGPSVPVASGSGSATASAAAGSGGGGGGSAGGGGSGSASASATASAAADGTLPATGGGYTSALSVGMGALLIAGGLLARRIVK